MRLINADELIEHAWRDKLDSRELIVEMINNAPTVKEIPTKIPIDIFEKLVSQEPKWTPVSEELPKEDGEYLLFGKIDEDEENYIFIGEYDSCGEQFGIWQEQFDRETLGCTGSEFFDYSSVIAWMPLPEPYKAESEKI